MAANVKLGVDMSAFKQGINDAKAQLKSFDAQLKFAEASFKKTGDAEAAMSTKTDALTNKLKTQKQMVQQYDKALQSMRASGIDPTSESYQKMQAAMINVQSAAIETEVALNGLNASQLNAASSADKLTQSVNSIGKKVSLDQVISGIEKITGGLENAAKKAKQVGEAIWNNILDSARLADDTGTAAMLLNMDVEEYQKYKGVFDTIAEMTVNDWMNAKRKVQKAIYDPTDDQQTVLAALGISTHGESPGKYGVVQTAAREWEDVFWDAATQLQKQVENGKISQDLADTYAEALFGKKANQLKPLMDLGRDAFTAALSKQNVASAEAIEKDAKLADTITKLNNSYKALEMELISAAAPALTEVATAIDSLLGKILEYLQTDKGKEMMDSLSDSLRELFDGLKNIKPEEIVQKFVDVFNDIIGGMKWLIKNKDTVIGALKGILIGWGALELTGGALQVLQLINGLKNLRLFGGNGGQPSGAEAAASGTGAETGVLTGAGPGGFWSNVLNKLTLSGLAGSYYEGVEKKLRQMIEDFNKRTEGKTDAERAKQALIENFNMTEEDYEALRKKMNNPNYGSDGGVPFDAVPVVEEGAAKSITDQVGVVPIAAVLQITGGFGGAGVNVEQEKANGIWAVPFDGYLARLHKNERVVPAREVASRSFSSNLYVENMNMGGGTDADALANAIANRNRRMMAGYGS